MLSLPTTRMKTKLCQQNKPVLLWSEQFAVFCTNGFLPLVVKELWLSQAPAFKSQENHSQHAWWLYWRDCTDRASGARFYICVDANLNSNEHNPNWATNPCQNDSIRLWWRATALIYLLRRRFPPLAHWKITWKTIRNCFIYVGFLQGLLPGAPAASTWVTSFVSSSRDRTSR